MALLDSHHESENQNSDMDGLHAEYHPKYIKNVNQTHCSFDVVTGDISLWRETMTACRN
jgi:hypothetical protein